MFDVPGKGNSPLWNFHLFFSGTVEKLESGHVGAPLSTLLGYVLGGL